MSSDSGRGSSPDGLSRSLADALNRDVQRSEPPAVLVNVETLAYAIAVTGPVDMDDTDDAARAYAEDILGNLPHPGDPDFVRFAAAYRASRRLP